MNQEKILLVVTQGLWGGAQRYVYDLAVNLAKNYPITVAVGEPNGQKDLQQKITAWNTQNADKKIELIQLSHLVRAISPIHDVLAVFELANLYKKHYFKAVHLNSSKAGVIGSLPKLLQKQKIIYTAHGWVFLEPLSFIAKKVYFWLERCTAKLKDKVIVLSEVEFDIARSELKIPENKLAIIPIGIADETKKYSKTEAKNILKKYISFDDNKKIAGTIANFYPTKGLDILFNAVAKNKEKLADYNFIIIGEGPERKKLEKIITDNGLENIIFLTGKIENASELLPAFDLFVLPSLKEGMPYTILEAQNAGLSIVATKVGGIPEIIEDKKTGLLVKPGDIDDLADNITKKLDNLTSNNLISATKNQYTIKEMTEKISNIISDNKLLKI